MAFFFFFNIYFFAWRDFLSRCLSHFLKKKEVLRFNLLNHHDETNRVNAKLTLAVRISVLVTFYIVMAVGNLKYGVKLWTGCIISDLWGRVC